MESKNLIRVWVEIEDEETGCTYIKKGADVADCVKQFQGMFFGKREYRILNSALFKINER